MENEDIPTLVSAAEIQQGNAFEKLRQSVPVTIITGYLGSGKTTLIMRMLNNPNLTQRIAVILSKLII